MDAVKIRELDGHYRTAQAVDGYLPYIDGLRAVAVLAVVVYHLWPAALPGGFVGVDIFFVISGFVVSASLAHAGRHGTLRLAAEFLSRRFRRILPAHLVCLLATILATLMFIPAAWLSRANAAVARAAVWGYSNIVLAQNTGAYYEPLAELNPGTHTWSLGVEEQFYVLFPWLFSLVIFLEPAARRRWRSALVFGLLAGLSLAWAALSRGTPDGFYSLKSRFWELGLGVLAQELGPRSASTFSPGKRRALIGAAFGAILAGLALARPANAPWADSLAPAFGTMLLLAALRTNGNGAVASMLGSPGPVALGKLSYSLYLWHWPVFTLFRWTIGLASPGSQIVALGLSLLLAAASYHLIERPFRGSTRLVRRPGLAIVCGLIALTSTHVLRSLLFRHQDDLSLSVTVNHDLWQPEPRRDSCFASAFDDGENARFGPGPCQILRPSSQIFVHGDSHATAYLRLFEHISSSLGSRIQVTHDCPLDLRDPPTPSCAIRLSSIRNWILAQAHPGDILFLPALRVPRFYDLWAKVKPRAEDRVGALAHAREWLAPFVAQGITVVLEAPLPIFKTPFYRCSDWFNRANPDCDGGTDLPRATVEGLRAPVLASFAALQQTLPALRVWDPMPTLCPLPLCTAFLAGKPQFFDADHLSGFGNDVLAPDFGAFLRYLAASTPVAHRIH